MQSSAGTINPQLRLVTWLAGLALAPLILALGLGFVSTLIHRPATNTQAQMAVQSVTTPATQSLAPPPGAPEQTPSPMWTLLEPWVYALDAVAIVGLGIVFSIRRSTQS